MRAIAGLISGLIAALITAVAVGMIGMRATFTLPPGLDPGNTRQLVDAIMAMPPGTQIALGIAWTVAAFVGAFVARRIGHSALAAWLVVLLIAAYFGFCAWAVHMPLWSNALWAIGPLAGGWLGNRPGKAAAEGAGDPAAEI